MVCSLMRVTVQIMPFLNFFDDICEFYWTFVHKLCGFYIATAVVKIVHSLFLVKCNLIKWKFACFISWYLKKPPQKTKLWEKFIPPLSLFLFFFLSAVVSIFIFLSLLTIIWLFKMRTAGKKRCLAFVV